MHPTSLSSAHLVLVQERREERTCMVDALTRNALALPSHSDDCLALAESAFLPCPCAWQHSHNCFFVMLCQRVHVVAVMATCGMLGSSTAETFRGQKLTSFQVSPLSL